MTAMTSLFKHQISPLFFENQHLNLMKSQLQLNQYLLAFVSIAK